jgi:cytochrome c556
MAQTKAEIEKILQAVENLQTTLSQLRTASDQADGVIQMLKTQGWQSTSAAPKFYSDAANWAADHQELIQFTNELIPLLQAAADDLRRAEAALAG